MGYAHGSFLMFLGLAISEASSRYFERVLNKFIALAPCIFYQSDFMTPAELITVYTHYEESEVYWTTSKIQSEHEKLVEMQSDHSEQQEWKAKKTRIPPQPMSVASQFYLETLALGGMFADYKPLDVYGRQEEKQIFTLDAHNVSLKNGSKVNIHMIVPENDEVCLPVNSMLIYDMLGTENKSMRYVRDNGGLPADHHFF